MVATITLDPQEAEFLTEETETSDVDTALRKATSEYIRYRKRMNLIELDIEIPFDESAVQAANDVELSSDTSQ